MGASEIVNVGRGQLKYDQTTAHQDSGESPGHGNCQDSGESPGHGNRQEMRIASRQKNRQEKRSARENAKRRGNAKEKRPHFSG